jgi:hypothetical protein
MSNNNCGANAKDPKAAALSTPSSRSPAFKALAPSTYDLRRSSKLLGHQHVTRTFGSNPFPLELNFLLRLTALAVVDTSSRHITHDIAIDHYVSFPPKCHANHAPLHPRAVLSLVPPANNLALALTCLQGRRLVTASLDGASCPSLSLFL